MAHSKRKLPIKDPQSTVNVRSVNNGRDPGRDSQREKSYNPQNPSPSSSSRQSVSKARLEANAYFWQDLGVRSDIQRSVRQKRRRASDRHDDLEKPQERYALHSNTCPKRVLLLQYPERKSRALYCAHNNQTPLEIRMKPKTGIVEVDIPLDTTTHYNKAKGVEFGSALRRSKMLHQHGAHGIAGGLDTAPPRQSFRGNDALVNDLPASAALENFEDSINEGRVLNYFTLGGRVEPFKDGDPIHMIATFQGSDCKWIKVDATVQLRAQFTHLDAFNADKRRLASTHTEKSEDKIKEERIEDVNMMIKETADSDNAEMYGGMNETSKLLRSIRDEPWQRLQWTDSSTQSARDVYQDSLLPHLPADAPYLVAKMTGEQYLDAISCPRVDPVTQEKHITASLRGDDATLSHVMPEGGLQDETEDEIEDGYRSSSSGYRPFDESDFGETLQQPNAEDERNIERVCRMLSVGTERTSARLEERFVEKFGEVPKYSFLHPGHTNHQYFRWRLKRNRSGNGISPFYDYDR